MKRCVGGAVLLLLLGSAGFARADHRSYVWTYEYATVPKGETEIETYYTLSTPDRHRLEGNVTVEHQYELEVGMTPRYDFAVYQIFEQAPGEHLEYKGFQLRGRYRLGERGQGPVDPLVYLEYKSVPDFSSQELEAKLVLAKDVGRFNFALNPTVEFEFEGGENEAELGYAMGVSYRRRLIRFGLEAKGDESGHYLGPVISHGGHTWVALGSAFNLGSVDEGKPEFELRMLLGIGL